MAFITKTRGSTIKVIVTVKDSSGSLYSPDTSTQITIKDPDGSNVVTSQAMTEDSTGNFSYLYQSSGSATAGWYKVIITSVDGSYSVVNQDLMAFKLTE